MFPLSWLQCFLIMIPADGQQTGSYEPLEAGQLNSTLYMLRTNKLAYQWSAAWGVLT